MTPLWLIVFGVGTLLLRTGFAMQASGSLRAKNATSSVLRITADTAAAALVFWAFGAALLFPGDNGWFNAKLLLHQPADMAGVEFFHLTICLIGGAVISGALAERVKFYVGVLATVVLAGVVVPITGHWVWYGWLHNLGFIDLGGATVIHLSAAVFAAVGVAVVGARAGKYNRDGSSNSIPGHALPMLGIGALLIFVGWFPYLLGCTATHYQYGSDSTIAPGITAMNIMLAGAGGVVGGLVFSHFRYRKPDVFFTYSGLLAALVAISPAAVAVSGIGAVSIGLVAGVIVPIAAVAVDMRARLDDPLGLIVIHGVGSIWGTLAAAFFVVLGPESGAVDHFRLLAVQALGIVAVMVPTSIVAMIVFLGMKLLGNLRVPAADETDGLDIGEHDLNSYPDFQQTTIKSYHMREA